MSEYLSSLQKGALNSLTEKRRKELDLELRGVLPGEDYAFIAARVFEADEIATGLGSSIYDICDAYLDAHTDPQTRTDELIEYHKHGHITIAEALSLALKK